MLTDVNVNRFRNTTTNPSPAHTPSRRLMKSGIRVLSVLVLTAAALNPVSAPCAFAGTEIVNHVRDPIVVDVTFDPLGDWLKPNDAHADALIAQVVATMRQAAAHNPTRVIALRLTNARYEFDKLTSTERKQIKDLAGDTDPATWYTEALARVLKTILTQTRAGSDPLMLSVSGLPVDEARSRSAAEIARINDTMKDVIADMQAIVIGRTFMQSGVNNEKNAIRSSLPNALKMSDGRPVFYKSNQSWRMAVSLDGPVHGTESHTQMSQTYASTAPPSDPMAALQAAWGQTDSEWDLNHDGVVDIDDLTIMVLNWNDWSQSGSDSQSSMGSFASTPTEYQIGSGQNLQLNVSSNLAGSVNVVFQVWSDATQSIEAPFADYDPPFVYPSASLDSVTPGGGEVQALIRNSDNQVQEIVHFGTVFVAAQAPSDPPSNGNDSGNSNDGGTTTPPTDPPPPPPSDPPSGGGTTSPPPTDGSVPTNPNAPSPTPVIKMVETTGMAPFVLHVHGIDSNLGTGSILNARFEWDFGDTTQDSQYNQLVGWNVAHVYDQPGTYTVTLRIINEQGGVATKTAQVTVTAAQRQYIYVSPTGNDSANGATQTTPVRTAARAMQLVADNSTVLFKRAATYDITGTMNIGTHKNVVIGAWGNGALPVINWTPNSQYSTMLNMDDQARDITIEDIDFDTPFTANKYVAMAITPAGTNILVRRCYFDDISYAMNAQASPTGLLALNNNADVIGAYFCWVQGSDVVLLGNTVAGSVEEHNIRLGGADRVYIAYNDLTNTVKTSIWSMLGKYCYIANNKMRKGRVVWGPNYALGSSSERFQYYVAENNEIFDEGVIVYCGAEKGVFRNNVVHADDREAFSIWGYYSPMDRTVTDVALYNNTAINNSSSYGRFMKLGAGAVRISVANNMYVAPNMNAQNGSVNVYDEDNTLGTNTFKNDLWAIPANGTSYHILNGGGLSQSTWASFSQVTNDHYYDFGNNSIDSAFQPQFTAEYGQALPGVMVDFRGHARPLTGTVTCGAVEMN
ncbi:MAG TPA: PKD domain-containing protein [Phycisphaerales bacterium]|nr:PKD domain-containing protein [Phycisphaerales bacterium]